MRPVAQWDRSDLEQLIGSEESQSLEFKRVEALKNGDEICKDVSGMANAAGGIIVYGIAEVPRADNAKIGVAADLKGDPGRGSGDRIHQILNQGVEPRPVGIVVRTIELDDGHAFAVEVPQAKTFAPHQARGKMQYFMRYGTEVLAMYDHQIRDVMRREGVPDLRLEFATTVSRSSSGEHFPISVTCHNRSLTPAYHCAIDILVDPRGVLQSYDAAWLPSNETIFWPGMDWSNPHKYSREFTANDLPMFRERPRPVFFFNQRLPVYERHLFGYRVACPGFVFTRLGQIFRLQHGGPMVEWSDGGYDELSRP